MDWRPAYNVFMAQIFQSIRYSTSRSVLLVWKEYLGGPMGVDLYGVYKDAQSDSMDLGLELSAMNRAQMSKRNRGQE
jgi:hypothetical protein